MEEFHFHIEPENLTQSSEKPFIFLRLFNASSVYLTLAHVNTAVNCGLKLPSLHLTATKVPRANKIWAEFSDMLFDLLRRRVSCGVL
jgi:hypothetical protein